MARRTQLVVRASPWTATSPAPFDADDMREDGMVAVTECFNDRKQAERRATWLGWRTLPMCPNSGKWGVVHPDFATAWSQKTNAHARKLLKVTRGRRVAGVPYSAIAYGF